ncbi:ATP-grasp domain-containing protein [Burkholderiaceae bacterium]|nr:ATP-grasp domain-containing protein [Burkholderiaceae bacterium]
MKALVIHARRTGLGIIRSLGIKGLTVYAADTYAAPGFYSKYVTKSYLIPVEVAENDEVLLDSLLGIGAENFSGEKIFLFTASDNYLVFFAIHAIALSKFFNIVSETNIDFLKDSLLKEKMYQVAKRAGVDYPRTFYQDTIDLDCISYPVIVKPSIRKKNGFDFGLHVFKVKICRCHDELVSAVKLLKDHSFDFIVQEFIEGDDNQLYTIGVFSYKGSVVASATGRKLRQFPPVTGECSYGELVSAPELLHLAEKFLFQCGVTGICQLEFKKYNGKYYLMEINPRPWSWISLFEHAGVNLPYIACQKLNNPAETSTYLQTNFSGTWIFSLMEIKYHVFGTRRLGIFNFFVNFIFAKRHAYFDPRDIAPVIFALYDFFRKPLSAWNHGSPSSLKTDLNKR